MSFAQLKANRNSSLQKLQEQLNKLNSRGDNAKTEQYWKPTVDAAGNGHAVIRFLPPREGEDMPFVRLWSYWFKNDATMKWYKENSRNTLGEDDPVGLYNRKLWNSGYEADKETARKQKRKESYISNILVISDPKNPENEGKVFLFDYGKKIFEKVNDKMNPAPEEGEDPINPFDFWEGADFKLRIRKGDGGYRNYDKSEFAAQSPLFKGDEKKLEQIYNQLHSLKEIIAPANFKPFDELEARFYEVIGEPRPGSAGAVEHQKGTAVARSNRQVDTDADEDGIDMESFAATLNAKEAAPSRTAAASATDTASDDEDDIDYFKRFAEDD